MFFSAPRFARLNLYNVEDDYVSRKWGQREQAPPYSMVINGRDPDLVVLHAVRLARDLRADHGLRRLQRDALALGTPADGFYFHVRDGKMETLRLVPRESAGALAAGIEIARLQRANQIAEGIRRSFAGLKPKRVSLNSGNSRLAKIELADGRVLFNMRSESIETAV